MECQSRGRTDGCVDCRVWRVPLNRERSTRYHARCPEGNFAGASMTMHSSPWYRSATSIACILLSSRCRATRWRGMHAILRADRSISSESFRRVSWPSPLALVDLHVTLPFSLEWNARRYESTASRKCATSLGDDVCAWSLCCRRRAAVLLKR